MDGQGDGTGFSAREPDRRTEEAVFLGSVPPEPLTPPAMAVNMSEVLPSGELIGDSARPRSKLAELFNLRPGEWTLVLAFGGLLTISTLISELADVVATSGFVSRIGPKEVPWLWIGDMLVTLALAGAYASIVDRSSRVKLITWLTGGMVAMYLVIQFLFSFNAPDWLTYPLLYIVSDQQYALFPLAFWALANDMYTGAETKRLFPLIGAGYTLGALLGNATAGLAALLFARTGLSPVSLVAACTIFSLIAYCILQVVFFGRPVPARQSRRAAEGLRAIFGAGLDYFRSVPVFHYLGLIILSVHLARTLLQFHFLSVVNRISVGTLQFQAVYSLYNVALIIMTVGFQLLAASRLLNRIQLKGAFWVLPITLMFAVVTTFVLPGWPGSAMGFFLVLLIEDAWDVPARKSLQNLVPDERRGSVSTFFDTYFYAIATIGACLLLLLLIAVAAACGVTDQVMTYLYLTVGAAAAVLAVWSALQLQSAYNKSLYNWRLIRSRRNSSAAGSRNLLENIEKKRSSAHDSVIPPH